MLRYSKCFGCIEWVDGDFDFRIRTVIRLSDNSESINRTNDRSWKMHAFVEEPSTSHCDCMVQSLSWMGRTPDSQPENGAWRLNEANYYHQGWLASGNTRGVIGITFTACLAKSIDPPLRTNFYLRGHRSEVKRLNQRFIFEFDVVNVSELVFVRWLRSAGHLVTLIFERGRFPNHSRCFCPSGLCC